MRRRGREQRLLNRAHTAVEHIQVIIVEICFVALLYVVHAHSNAFVQHPYRNRHVKIVGEWKPARAGPFRSWPQSQTANAVIAPISVGVAPWVRSNPVIERASNQHDFYLPILTGGGGYALLRIDVENQRIPAEPNTWHHPTLRAKGTDEGRLGNAIEQSTRLRCVLSCARP